MITYLNSIAQQQAHTNQNTESAIKHFLDYTSTNPDTVVQFWASDMVLHIDSYAAYLSEPHVRKHTRGHYYLILQPVYPTKYPNLVPPSNGPIHTELIIMRDSVAYTAKAEVCGLFHYGKTAITLHINLNELGFPLPPTAIKTNNSAGEGIVASTFI